MFYGCELLKSVVLSDNIVKIDDYAFSICYKLESINFTPKLTTIGNYVFDRCVSLKQLTFPASLTTLGEAVFKQCFLKIDTSHNDHFLFVDDMLFSKGNTLLTDHFGQDSEASFKIHSQCTIIGTGTFSGKKLKKLTFDGNSLTEIKGNAFSGSTLVEITIPSSLTTLGTNCFESCNKLTTVTFTGNKISVIPNYCFKNCFLLSEFQLPTSITSIGDYAFSRCFSISDIGFQNTAISILGLSSFEMSGLSAFDVSHTLSKVGIGCFESSSLTHVEISVESIPELCFNNCTLLNYLTLNDGIATIESKYFMDCISLTSLTIPKTVDTIRSFAFKGCTSLSMITLSSGSKLRDVYGGAFFDCDSLNTVKSNSENHTYNNGALTDVNETILITFFPSIRITTFIVPPTMQSIGNYAFMGSKYLTRVLFYGDRLTDIGYMSFTNCTSLSFLYVPSSNLATIGKDAFDGCTKLRKCGSVQCMKTKRSKFSERGIPDIAFAEICAEREISCKQNSFSSLPGLSSFAVFISIAI